MTLPARRRIALVALLLATVVWNLVPAQPTSAAGACLRTTYWDCPSIPLGSARPTSIATDGLSLFMMDVGDVATARPPKILQFRFEAGNAFTTSDLGWLPTSADLPPPGLGQLILGPRAFYAIVTFPDPVDPTTSVPLLWRADRIPTAIEGGWRFLRQTAGPADLGLSAVVMDRTVWMLRSCSVCAANVNAVFAVDWQPLATENQQILQPPGPTIDLGRDVHEREAAGVTATQDALYVFGGRSEPTSAVRIPLTNGKPGVVQPLSALPHGRTGATALVHGNNVYLVGGNVGNDPFIERGRISRGEIDRGKTDCDRKLKATDKRIRGDLPTPCWEPLPDPALPPGVKILTGAFARGRLWIVRDDGVVQSMSVDQVVPGRSFVSWDRVTGSITRPAQANPIGLTVAPPAPIKVQRGDTIDLFLDWSYTGAQTLDGLTVTTVSSLVDTGIKKSSGIVSVVGQSVYEPGEWTLTPPNTDGPQLHLKLTIPTTVTDSNDKLHKRQRDDRRTEYNATVQVSAGRQQLGPLLRLRFVVERPKRS